VSLGQHAHPDCTGGVANKAVKIYGQWRGGVRDRPLDGKQREHHGTRAEKNKNNARKCKRRAQEDAAGRTDLKDELLEEILDQARPK